MEIVDGKKWSFAAVRLALAFLLSSCLPTKQEDLRTGSGTELGNVIGILYSPQSKPAAGLTVALYPIDGDTSQARKTVTGADGAFSFSGVSGSYRLLSLDGHGNGILVDSISPMDQAPVDLRIRQLAPLGGFSGYAKVINPRGEARVRFYYPGLPFRDSVPANAPFTVSGIPAGRYWLSADYPGSHALSIPVTIAADSISALPDTLLFQSEISAGFSPRDTVRIIASQLPMTFEDKLTGVKLWKEVDTALWVLNGDTLPVVFPDSTNLRFEIRPGMLKDTGLNLLELRLYLKDSVSIRTWLLYLDRDPVKQYAQQAVRAVFLSKEANPVQNTSTVNNTSEPELGAFRILERHALTAEERRLWGFAQAENADTAVPSEIKVPINNWAFDALLDCRDRDSWNRPFNFFPGDTVTFFLVSDSINGPAAIRIRNDERYQDLANTSWVQGPDWPLGNYFLSLSPKNSDWDLSIRPDELRFRFLQDNFEGQSYNRCMSIVRDVGLDHEGRTREHLATPAGFHDSTLLLHFRTDLSHGFFPDAIPTAAGKYVYIDSAGKVLSGSGTEQRESRLDSVSLAGLRLMLAGFPTQVPWSWEEDFFQAFPHLSESDMAKGRYMYSAGRGAVTTDPLLSGSSVPEKNGLFLSIENWLSEKGLL